jgi:demethylmenaquinone methyltransferase/2-methoxy-6-polyprenyl-1,4-benzoquinol methylase
MSTYVLMRILESAPHRYELGIRLLTLGQVDRAYDGLAGHIQAGERVLDIGCGTGALTLRAAHRGAQVKGMDTNPHMLEMAEQALREAGLTEQVELVEMGVAELDREGADSYDAAMSGLCFSELSQDELAYTLKQVKRILKPGGLLLVADEVRPKRLVHRWLHATLRAPLAALTYLVTQHSTRPIPDLPEKLAAADLSMLWSNFNNLGSFGQFVARRPPAGDPRPPGGSS